MLKCVDFSAAAGGLDTCKHSTVLDNAISVDACGVSYLLQNWLLFSAIKTFLIVNVRLFQKVCFYCSL